MNRFACQFRLISMRSALMLVCSSIGPWLLTPPTFTTADEVDRSVYVMDTQVFVGDADEATQSTTTIFFAGRAYDRTLAEPNMIARYDFESQTITLLDGVKETKTDISFEDVLQFQAQLRAVALRRSGLAAFLAKPSFIREFDASKSTFKLSSPWMSYEAHGIPANSEDVEEFVEFANWSSRLSGMLNQGAPPAEARMELNEVIEKRGWRVTRVTRTGGPRAPGWGSARSEHQYRDQLSDKDRSLIQGVEKDLKTFALVPFAEYRASRNAVVAVTKN